MRPPGARPVDVVYVTPVSLALAWHAHADGDAAAVRRQAGGAARAVHAARRRVAHVRLKRRASARGDARGALPGRTPSPARTSPPARDAAAHGTADAPPQSPSTPRVVVNGRRWPHCAFLSEHAVAIGGLTPGALYYVDVEEGDEVGHGTPPAALVLTEDDGALPPASRGAAAPAAPAQVCEEPAPHADDEPSQRRAALAELHALQEERAQLQHTSLSDASLRHEIGTLQKVVQRLSSQHQRQGQRAAALRESVRGTHAQTACVERDCATLDEARRHADASTHAQERALHAETRRLHAVTEDARSSSAARAGLADACAERDSLHAEICALMQRVSAGGARRGDTDSAHPAPWARTLEGDGAPRRSLPYWAALRRADSDEAATHRAAGGARQRAPDTLHARRRAQRASIDLGYPLDTQTATFTFPHAER
ncbi:hypothetical protein MSPP1_004210 [Malassezia sp. CBS 17886]|nr:hypothetical protein MSPP1_004210 [Malassezia sp. CBS 17886]